MVEFSKSLLDLLLVILGLLVAGVSGAFAFATFKYYLSISRLKLQVERQNFVLANKLQKNVINLRVQMGVVKCDVRDIKTALVQEGILTERANFPEQFIPESTDWSMNTNVNASQPEDF
jgi:hypothetical protein